MFGCNRGGAGRKRVGLTSRGRLPLGVSASTFVALEASLNTPQFHQVPHLPAAECQFSSRDFLPSCHPPRPRQDARFAVQECQGPSNLPLDCPLLWVARLAWMWREQPCAREALRGGENLSIVVLEIWRVSPLGVTDLTDLRDVQSVTGGAGGALAPTRPSSSLDGRPARLTCGEVYSSDEHIKSIDLFNTKQDL